jgi:Xaa-Pro aminopeptidase
MSSFASADVAVEALRKKMIDAKLDIFLIPASDAHGSEYVSKVDERRAFISNFNGSAGLAAVVASPTDERRKSSLFTDSRYKLQSQKQLSSQWNVYISGEKNSPKLSEWLLNFKASTTIGFDPRYSSISTVTNWKKELNESNNISLVEILDSPVDAVWEEMGKEKPTIHPIWPLSDDLSGASTASKIESLRKTMKEKRTRIAVVSALDDVAWLLNLRGGDIPYTPLFISYCVVSEKDVTLLVDIEKLSKDALHFLKESNVSIEPYENIKQVLESMSSSDATTDTTTTPISIWLDPLSANWHLKSICQNLGLKIFSKSTLPISLSKAIKNSIEIHSIQEAHIVDGVALCKYFHWLEETMKEAVIQAKESKNEEWNGELQLDEVDAADQLYQFRKETSPSFIGNSFSTISSSGPNGAIVHYEPTPGNCRKLNVNELYLCDSGGQYISPHLGTTDVTRCYKHSEPTHLEKSCYTRVLQGHIDLSSAIFPPGTEGHKLDIIARLPLFSIGKNYGHGTGHGKIIFNGCFFLTVYYSYNFFSPIYFYV